MLFQTLLTSPVEQKNIGVETALDPEKTEESTETAKYLHLCSPAKEKVIFQTSSGLSTHTHTHTHTPSPRTHTAQAVRGMLRRLL